MFSEINLVISKLTYCTRYSASQDGVHAPKLKARDKIKVEFVQRNTKGNSGEASTSR